MNDFSSANDFEQINIRVDIILRIIDISEKVSVRVINGILLLKLLMRISSILLLLILWNVLAESSLITCHVPIQWLL